MLTNTIKERILFVRLFELLYLETVIPSEAEEFVANPLLSAATPFSLLTAVPHRKFYYRLLLVPEVNQNSDNSTLTTRNLF